MSITFPRKPRKEGPGLFTLDGNQVFIGKDWALQNEIYEAKEKTEARSCFRGCNTCGACANSKRDATYPYSYDYNTKHNINCRSCEPFRFHDCHNGVMRDSRQDPEPFTDDQVKIIESSYDAKPLM